MSANGSSAFASIFSFLKTSFLSVFSWLDNIYISNNVSLLDLNIAIIVFSIIFTAVFSVVRSGVDNSIGSVNKIREKKAREAEKERARAARKG